MERIGDIYQEETRYHRDRMPGGVLDWDHKPETYKRYDSAVSVVQLPPPRVDGGMPLWDAIAKRRSMRRYTGEPLELHEVSQLVWAAQGITARTRGYEFRAAPSAGALYPDETYLVANNVTGIQPGVYHYEILQHQLRAARVKDVSADIARACLDQGMAARAAVVFAWTAVVERSKWKYKERGYRYMYLDAGHICENVHLAAVALGFGCCAIGAFYDEEVNAILGVDGIKETAIYLCAVGKV